MNRFGHQYAAGNHYNTRMGPSAAGGKVGVVGWVVILIAYIFLRKDLKGIFKRFFGNPKASGDSSETAASNEGLPDQPTEGSLPHENSYYAAIAAGILNQIKDNLDAWAITPQLVEIANLLKRLTRKEEVNAVIAFFGTQKFDESWYSLDYNDWSGDLITAIQHQINRVGPEEGAVAWETFGFLGFGNRADVAVAINKVLNLVGRDVHYDG